MLVEQRLQNDKKSTGVAYLLWFFLDLLGAYRFYLRRTASAVAMLLLFIFGWVLLAAVVGGFMLLGVLIWALVDAFLTPKMIEADTTRKHSRLSTEVGLTTVA